MIHTIALLAAFAGAPDLGPELLAAHPGHETGDYATVREDLLVALEADPGSPHAATAVAEILELDHLCARPLAFGRVAALMAEVTDPLASLRLRRLVSEEVARRRFSRAPVILDGDLWSDFLSQWRVIGPLGRLDAPVPMRAEIVDGPAAGPRETHVSAWGEPLAWRPLPRREQSLLVEPWREIPHSGAGVGFALTYVRCAEVDLVLEVLVNGPVQVYWNGALVHEELVRALGEEEDRIVVPISGAADWNSLLLRFPNERLGLGARLLDRAGRTIDVEELPADSAEHPSIRPGEVPPPLPRPRAGVGLESVAWMLDQIARRRVDRALSVPRPAAEEAQLSWLWARFRALDEALHLPSEVRRRGLLEVEAEMERLGRVFPIVRSARAVRLVQEDKPAEGLAEIDALLAEVDGVPVFEMTRTVALNGLDTDGTLGRAQIMAMTQEFPRHPFGFGGMALLAADAGDLGGAREWWAKMLAVAGGDRDAQREVFTAAARVGGEALAEARSRLAAWAAEQPGDSRPRELLRLVLETAGDDVGLETLLRAELAERPHRISAARNLAQFLTARGRRAEATQLFEGILERSPGDTGARAVMSAYGSQDPAERFFAAFAPDREDAIANGGGARDASTAEVLDSGMTYIHPDGSSHLRFHTITLALDRKGTELLHEEPVAEHVLLARVLKRSGEVLEPMEVNGSWVMPSLDPGDAVELVWDSISGGLPGVAPDLGWWRFSSFEKPFVRSRYVIFVPDGLPGELRSFHFEGNHEEIAWENGTVHVFLAEDQPRQKEEPWCPSYEEVLPWLQYGADVPIAHVEALWRDRIELLTHLPEDLVVELEAVASSLPQGMDARARAEELYRVVTGHVLDFGGTPLAAHVWLLRRGNPTFLFGALLDLAGVPYEWAVLERGTAPELDAEPMQAFENIRGYEIVALRFPGTDDTGPQWHIGGVARGARFGLLPDRMAGARALVLGDEGARWEDLPRDRLEDSWDLDLTLTYTVAADGAAAVTGRWRVSTAQGAVMREQLAQAGGVQRQSVARNVVGQFVPGLDLTDSDFPGIEEKGSDLVLAFEGRIPGFVQDSGGGPAADLRMPPTGLSTGFGAAQRTWPLALRIANRTRVRTRLVPGPGWRIAGGPSPFREERDGFLHALEVDTTDDAWEWKREFGFRGLVVPAEEMSAFLTRQSELEKEETRPVRLERIR